MSGGGFLHARNLAVRDIIRYDVEVVANGVEQVVECKSLEHAVVAASALEQCHPLIEVSISEIVRESLTGVGTRECVYTNAGCEKPVFIHANFREYL